MTAAFAYAAIGALAASIVAWSAIVNGRNKVATLDPDRTGDASGVPANPPAGTPDNTDDYKKARGALNLTRPSEQIIRDQR